MEGRTELRGRGSEPLSRGHRNTGHRCLLVCNNTTKSLIFGSPVDPGVIPYGYGRDNWKIDVHVSFVRVS